MPENLFLYNAITSLFIVFVLVTGGFLIAKIWQRGVRRDDREQDRQADDL